MKLSSNQELEPSGVEDPLLIYQSQRTMRSMKGPDEAKMKQAGRGAFPTRCYSPRGGVEQKEPWKIPE